MAPQILLIRHAQGFHNVSMANCSIRDPSLTPLGKDQCSTLSKSISSSLPHISQVTASPLTRTVNTAFLTFQSILMQGDQVGKCKKQILALPDAQETSDYPCDMGSTLPELRKRCESNEWPVDLSQLNEEWCVKEGRYEPVPSAISARAAACRRQLHDLSQQLVQAGDHDAVVALVTHGGYLHYLTEDWEDADKFFGTGWGNCEARWYTIEGEGKGVWLRETAESRKARGKEGKPWTRERQKEEYERRHDLQDGEAETAAKI